MTLQWNAVTGATSYTLKRATVSGGPYANVATGLTGTNTTNAGLTNGTTYDYVVSAVNGSGESPNSAQVSAKPAAPVKYEAESLTWTGPAKAVISDTQFSAGKGVYFGSTAAGQVAAASVNVPDARTYDIRVGVKKYSSRGIWQFASDGVNHGSPVDSYKAAPLFTEVDLGTVTFAAAGAHSFRFTVAGKNAASSGFTMCFDYITLVPR